MVCAVHSLKKWHCQNTMLEKSFEIFCSMYPMKFGQVRKEIFLFKPNQTLPMMHSTKMHIGQMLLQIVSFPRTKNISIECLKKSLDQSSLRTIVGIKISIGKSNKEKSVTHVCVNENEKARHSIIHVFVQ